MPREIKSTICKMKVGERKIFPVDKWGTVRRIALMVKREQDDDRNYTVNRKANTVHITRLV